MTRSRRLTLDDLPLFASDSEIAEAVVGPDRVKTFLERLATLENDGFPRTDPFYGGRYVPRVKAFFEARAGRATAGTRPIVQDRHEDHAAWNAGRSKRRA